VCIVERPIPALKPGEVLVKINAAGFNHKDVRCPRITHESEWDHRNVPSFFFSSGFERVVTRGSYPVAR
jgi:NADPH:quinone reductase-like Zn-dependent oxidoreductase